MASFLLPSLVLFLFLLFSPSISKETQTHLHFYFHEVVAGPFPTAVRIAVQASNKTDSSMGFGSMVMMDDPLTEGPNLSSKLIGRAQGIYAVASQESDFSLLMTMNLAFIAGEYNGSTLAVVGRNAVFSGVREMPVVGGSGRFRFARGYALAKNYLLDATTGNFIVEYNVFIRHFIRHH